MEISPSLSPVDVNTRLESLERRAKRRFASLTLFCLVLVLLVGLGGFSIWQTRKIARNLVNVQKSEADLQFSDSVNDYNHGSDFVTVDIGTIQFLRRGFSITFDSANYSENGLTLSGTLGNPTQLWITSLTLNLSARPYPYQVRNKWDKDKFIFWNTSDFQMGSAQVNVGVLNPGATTPFTVTIPNVKQTKDQPEIAVWFSGERYSYLK